MKLINHSGIYASTVDMYITESGQTLKYVSLVTLTLQNAMVGLSMRYSRTRAGDMFLSSTGKYKTVMNNTIIISIFI